MLLIRPVLKDDLEGFLELLELSGPGLTSLPKGDRTMLKRRIAHSVRSFAQEETHKPGGELYLFMMEDLEKKKLVGVSGILSKIGGFDPIYFYRVEKHHRKSELTKVENTITALLLEKVYDGPAEVCSLFLDPSYRNSQNGRFLSLTRFLFIAGHQDIFEKQIIAQMRGRVDEHGHSPFWEAVGKKFFKMPFPQADSLTLKSKSFVEELLPKYPIIVDLLPQEAQDVVAKVHPDTEPALRILEQEGFSKSEYVGIFDPGPVVKAELAQIRSVKNSKVVTISKIEEKLDGQSFIISNLARETFRATLGTIFAEPDGSARIAKKCAETLNVGIGDQVRFISLK